MALIGWEKRLVQACTDWQRRPFVWGSSDCLHFCMACERAIKGASVFDDFPSYTTEAGGFRQMRKMGFDAIPDFIDSKFKRVAVSAARRGDWVMLDQGGPCAFGVNVGRKVAVMSGDGVIYYPALSGDVAWRVA